MSRPAASATEPRTPIPASFHYGWIIVGLTFFANLNGAGIRAVPAVLINPLEANFGWSRTEIASAGAVSPFVGALLDWFGPRRVMLLVPNHTPPGRCPRRLRDNDQSAHRPAALLWEGRHWPFHLRLFPWSIGFIALFIVYCGTTSDVLNKPPSHVSGRRLEGA